MRKLLTRLLVLTAFVSCVCSAPTFNRNDVRKTAAFFLRFGYINISNPTDTAGANSPNSPVFKKAIRRLQWFGGIPVTGVLDSKTLRLISTSRCGLRDPPPPSSRGIGEFKLQGTFWKKKDLTYKIVNYTPDNIPRYKQGQIFQEAMRKWEDASGLRIRQVYSGYADILISFVTRDHGDGYPFDGQQGTLAHAFYPHNNEGLSGDAHFDDDERFTTGKSDGINLDWVALHEFGHSFGLEHSNVREAVMYPWYKGYVKDIKLTNDDKQGIQALYPKPTMSQRPTTVRTTTKATTTKRPRLTPRPRPVTPSPVTPRPGVPYLCRGGVHYDAVVNAGPRRGTFFFVGNRFWIINSILGKRGPYSVKSYWKRVKTPVDAVYLNKRQNIVFFKGAEFWEYKNRRLINSGPIRRYFRSSAVANMDAIFVWERYPQRTYVFKGSQYWRYNERQRRLDTVNYPRNIALAWRGFPSGGIDAAATWVNNRSYIFKGEKYWRLIKGFPRVQARYPQRTDEKWMKCNTNVGGLAIGSLGGDP